MHSGDIDPPSVERGRYLPESENDPRGIITMKTIELATSLGLLRGGLTPKAEVNRGVPPLSMTTYMLNPEGSIGSTPPISLSVG